MCHLSPSNPGRSLGLQDSLHSVSNPQQSRAGCTQVSPELPLGTCSCCGAAGGQAQHGSEDLVPLRRFRWCRGACYCSPECRHILRPVPDLSLPTFARFALDFKARTMAVSAPYGVLS